jgi:hypothetical protein
MGIHDPMMLWRQHFGKQATRAATFCRIDDAVLAARMLNRFSPA